MKTDVEITVVIPHYNGIEILRDCLDSLYQNEFKSFETLLIDNGSSDGSPEFVKNNYPQVNLIRNKNNRGYAGACNQGIEMVKTPFILLLNNDTVMPENFLAQMLDAIKKSKSIAMVQPKILSIQDKRFFDYSGGAGGEMDIFGYPFARGRIFDMVERDKGQYNKLDNRIFWTSGCALLVRKSVTNEIGVLDEDFFAHQEEIDLNWRAQLCGYRNVVTNATHIYHYSGYTLRSDNERKMYLNHRNNLIMMIKNYSMPILIFLFPVRIIMEMATIVADSILWDGRRAKAVLKALQFIFANPGFIYKKRRVVQKIRKVSDRAILHNMYPGSIVIDHFLRKLTPFASIKKYRK